MSSRSGKGPSSNRGLVVHVRKANKRSVQSRAWLERQLNDPYVAAAQAQGWRSRAAFKLIEMDDRFGLIKPGMRVLDRTSISPDEVQMNVYLEGIGRVEKVSMQLIGGDWKFGGYIRNAK